MKQMDVFKKIGGILKELNDQYDYLAADSNDLNELELELFVANAHFLKDHAEILRRLHERSLPTQPAPAAETPEPVIEKPILVSSPSEKKQEPIHEQRYFEPVVQQKPTTEKFELTQAAEPPVQPPYNPIVPEPVITPEKEEEPVAEIDLKTESPTTVDSYSFERQEPDPVKQELEIDTTTPDWDDEDDRFEQEELTEQLPPLAVEKEPTHEPPFTLATNGQASHDLNGSKETNEDKVLTINQKISALLAEKEKGASQPALLPITDLKSAINLNDKLLYIKDLFNGYSLAYSEAVEIVNRFNSFEEAERFLKTNYVTKNHWADKPTTAEKFFDLLRRRYPAS